MPDQDSGYEFHILIMHNIIYVPVDVLLDVARLQDDNLHSEQDGVERELLAHINTGLPLGGLREAMSQLKINDGGHHYGRPGR